MIGVGPAIPDTAEFNRRALIALRGVDLGDNGFERGLADSVSRRIYGQQPLTVKQQKALYALIYKHRGQVTDRALIDYASVRAGSY